jgi:hypothetical protein
MDTELPNSISFEANNCSYILSFPKTPGGGITACERISDKPLASFPPKKMLLFELNHQVPYCREKGGFL